MDSFKSWTKNEELKSWARDTIASIENCAERMKDKRLSDKDRDSFGVMLVQLSQAIKHDAEYPNNLAMRDMSNWLLDAFDALINDDVAAFEAKYEILRQLSFFGEVLISEEERASWAAEDREDGRTYIDFIPTSLTNEQSKQIVEHLQSIGAKFDPEVGQWYVEADWEMPELSQGEKENKNERQPERLNGDDMEYKVYYEEKFIGEVTSYGDITIDKALEREKVDVNEVKDWEKVRIERSGRVFSWKLLGIDLTKMEAYYSINATEDGETLEQIYDADLEKVSNEIYKITDSYSDNGRFNAIEYMLSSAIEHVINERAKKLEIENNQEEKKENEIMDENQTNVTTNETQYKAIYYDGKERKEIFAETKENVFKAVQEAKTDRKETDRCYIQEREADSENYKQEGIYLIDSGRDVTPVEIKVPHLASEAFNEVKDYIKEMGAKFDVNKKMWYMERSESQETMDMIQSYIDSKTLYKAVYYDGKERKEVFADTKEHVLQAVQEVKPERKETDRCYIQERGESGAYNQEGIYLIESGKDVTPVELKKPYISQETYSEIKQELKEMGARFDADKKIWYAERSLGEDAIKQLQEFLDKHNEGIYLNLPKTKTSEEFKAQVEQLKQDGARYNPDKKAWYITDKADRSKFADYLPAEKTSIHAKLEQNRKTAEQNEQGKERSMEPKNKENHERA